MGLCLFRSDVFEIAKRVWVFRALVLGAIAYRLLERLFWALSAFGLLERLLCALPLAEARYMSACSGRYRPSAYMSADQLTGVRGQVSDCGRALWLTVRFARRI